MIAPVHPEPLADALAAVTAAPVALLAVGRPACPACELLEMTLGIIAAARPGLTVASTALDSPEDWAGRETLLWPRAIRVSRASMPTLVLLRDGTAVSHRHGGGPAAVVDEWLTEHLGPGETTLSGVSELEREALAGVADLRERHLAAKAGRGAPDIGG